MTIIYLKKNKLKKSVEIKNDDYKEEVYDSINVLPNDEFLVIDNLSVSNSNNTEYVSDETVPDEKVETDDITGIVKEKTIKNEKRSDFVSILSSQQTISYKSNPKNFEANDVIFGERLKILNVLNGNYDIMLKSFINAYVNNNYDYNDSNYNGSNNNDYYYNKTEKDSSFMSNDSFMDSTIYRENQFDNMIKSNNKSITKSEKGQIIPRP